MKIVGKVWKSRTDNFWLVEVPLLNVMTQAKSKKETAVMIKDAIECLIDDTSFSVAAFLVGNTVCIETSDSKKLIALILKQQRYRKNLTLEDVAEHLHAKSVNEYAQYEQGKHQPSFEKFAQLLEAIDPRLSPVISCLDKNGR